MPANNCTSPPTKKAMPTIALGWVICRVDTLYIPRRNVVDARDSKPLGVRHQHKGRSSNRRAHRAAGSAILQRSRPGIVSRWRPLSVTAPLSATAPLSVGKVDIGDGCMETGKYGGSNKVRRRPPISTSYLSHHRRRGQPCSCGDIRAIMTYLELDIDRLRHK
jgi:hypothetical protein